MTGASVHIPTLETERLTLRAPRLPDVEPYAAFLRSERARTIGGPFANPEAFTRLSAVAGQWLLRGYGRWIVADRATDAPLGLVGIFHPDDWPEAEIGWSVFEAAEGRGIAFEAAEAARRYVYEVLGWTRIVSLVAPDNTRSAALARRLGAVIEGSFPHPVHGQLDIWRHPSPKELAA